MTEYQTTTTAELRELYDEMDENGHQGYDFENWKGLYCERYGFKELKPEIAIVVEGGNVVAIATAGQGMIVRVIDLDQKKIGEKAITDYAPDAENVSMEQYTKQMMGDD